MTTFRHFSTMALTGKTAFVTGAGSGIGRATCQVLAREGANIIAADVNEKTAKETIDSLKKSETCNKSLCLNVTSSCAVKSALTKILESYKDPPSIIVNCAGIDRDGLIVDSSEEKFQEVLDINLKGVFLVMLTFGRAILERKLCQASIINISSILGKYGNVGQGSYCASKAGVAALTKVAAMEWGKDGIRVNAILPGFIATPMTSIVPEEMKKGFVRKLALLREGKPQEIAEVVAFLASERSSYITGACIDVNGGWREI